MDIHEQENNHFWNESKISLNTLRNRAFYAVIENKKTSLNFQQIKRSFQKHDKSEYHIHFFFFFERIFFKKQYTKSSLYFCICSFSLFQKRIGMVVEFVSWDLNFLKKHWTPSKTFFVDCSEEEKTLSKKTSTLNFFDEIKVQKILYFFRKFLFFKQIKKWQIF